MQGRMPGMNGYGTVDLGNNKFALKQYFFTRWLNTSKLPAVVKEQYRTVLADHKSCRQSCGYPNDEKTDLSWRADWQRAAVSFFTSGRASSTVTLSMKVF